MHTWWTAEQKKMYHLQGGVQAWSSVGSDVYSVSGYISSGWVHRTIHFLLPVPSSCGPPGGTPRTWPVHARCHRVELGWPRCHFFRLEPVLQLQLRLQLRLLLGFLVALLQMLHQDGDDNVDQDELSGQNKGDEVDGRDHSVVAGGGGVMSAVP